MVQLAKKSQTQGRITISTIANAIFHDIGMSSDEWSFCDILFIRLFERVNKKYLVGSAFVLHVSCFLALFSLSPAEDLMRTIVDIYLDSESMKDNLGGVGKAKKMVMKKSSVTMKRCPKLLNLVPILRVMGRT